MRTVPWLCLPLIALSGCGGSALNEDHAALEHAAELASETEGRFVAEAGVGMSWQAEGALHDLIGWFDEDRLVMLHEQISHDETSTDLGFYYFVDDRVRYVRSESYRGQAPQQTARVLEIALNADGRPQATRVREADATSAASQADEALLLARARTLADSVRARRSRGLHTPHDL